MTTPYDYYHPFPHAQPQLTPPPSPSIPATIPSSVYRVHRTSSQTRYSFSTGFDAKNHTTIVNYTASLSRFGLAHLNQQTNISSPFISVYDNLAHAEDVAKWMHQKYNETTSVVMVDTKHLARGPVFRAADLLNGNVASQDGNGKGKVVNEAEAEWLHYGEYLVMYNIPREAIRCETPIARAQGDCRAIGAIGES